MSKILKFEQVNPQEQLWADGVKSSRDFNQSEFLAVKLVIHELEGDYQEATDGGCTDRTVAENYSNIIFNNDSWKFGDEYNVVYINHTPYNIEEIHYSLEGEIIVVCTYVGERDIWDLMDRHVDLDDFPKIYFRVVSN